MKKLFRPLQLLWVSLLCCVTLFAQTGLRISKVEIKNVGPAAASDALILSNIRVKQGDAYQRTRVDEDVKNLYATGYFYNIRIAQENTAEGVKLTYILQGKPTLTEIKFSGNKKYSNRKLLKKISSKVGEPLDDKKLFDDARTIEKMYEKAGYQKTTVKPVLSIDENAGRGTVTFEVHETHKTRIKNINFQGVVGFKQSKLRKVLKTKQSWMFSWLTGSNVYKEEQFEDDKDRLIEFFQNEGYVDAEIKDVKFDNISKKKMNVTFVIEQGRRYQVGEITIKGNKLFTTNDIMKGIVTEGRTQRMQMLVGKYFTPKGFNKDQEAIVDFYGSKGYIDAKINAQKIPNTATGTMDVVYEIEEGDKSFIERIEIKGNEKTKDKVIRRELSVTPGEVFDMVKVKLSKERLEGLQFFEKVDAKPENTDVQNRKNLVVGVEEKNTGSLTFGAGFSSVDAVVGFVEVAQANFDLFKPPTFTGGGQKFRLRAQVGSKRQDYLLSFVEPWFLNRKLAFGVDLYHRDLDFVSIEDFYSERHTGANLSLTRALLGNEMLIGRLAYTIESAELTLSDAKNIPPEIRSQAGDYLISKVGSSLAYDTRNSYSLPNRGQRTELISEVAGLGGNVHFFKLEARSAWYFPGFMDGHILEVVGRTGAVQSYGSGDRGTNDVPIFDRWFLGGLYSLRGFRYRDVGPKANGEALGGDTYWFGSAEYSIPVIERLRFAVFYDAGNVLRNPFTYSRAEQDIQAGQAPINDDWGIGLRINLPIGPLRLDYGFPITHDENTSGAGRFQFGVGYTREF